MPKRKSLSYEAQKKFTEEWDAVYQHYSISLSKEEAIAKADKIVEALYLQMRVNKEDLDASKAYRRRVLRNKILSWVAGAVVLATVLAAAFSTNRMYADDWGGYDKSKVYGANSLALTEWYGKNDNVDNFRMVEGPTRDRLAGKEAWLTIYNRPDNGKTVCVRVRENEPYYGISEDEGCAIASSR